MSKRVVFLVLVLSVVALPSLAFASDGSAQPLLPLAVAITMGLAAIGGTFGQSKAIAASVEAMGRNPSAAGPVRLAMIIGLVLIESLVIISFVIALFLNNQIAS